LKHTITIGVQQHFGLGRQRTTVNIRIDSL